MQGCEHVAAVGVGYSKTGRNTGLTSWQMAIQATKAALANAGLEPGAIDGVAVLWDVAGPAPDGLDRVASMDVAYMFGMSPVNWYSDGAGPAYIGPAVQAIAAIRAGFCHTVLTLRIINQRLTSKQMLERDGDESPTLVTGDPQFSFPFGAIAPLVSIAGLPSQRHMALYGTTEEQFGAHVVAQRHHASLNDDALFREPLTVADYLDSRYVSKPVRLLDCDYPVDSASAVIYTTPERARDLRQKAVLVEAAAYTSVKYQTFDNLDDITRTAPFHTAEQLWSRTSLKPDDVDCAQLYDGFTIITFQWLEALGFCGVGESGPFVEAGHTRLGGTLPVNTDGGACNVGRRHGANFCIEAVRQLRGDCGPRQVPDASVAVWANAAGPYAGAVLMTAD